MKILLLSLCLATTVRTTAQSVEVSSYVPPKQSTVLATTFVDWNSLVPNPTSTGQVRHVFDNSTVAMDKLEVHITTLNPGMESHPIHRHPWEEILLVKDGDFEVSINGRKQHAGPGAMVFLASNDPHNARNVGNKPATYYVINFVTDLSHSASAKSAATGRPRQTCLLRDGLQPSALHTHALRFPSRLRQLAHPHLPRS